MAINVEPIITASQTYAAETFSVSLDLIGDAITAVQGFSYANIPAFYFNLDYIPDLSDPGAFGDFTDSYVSPDGSIDVPVYETLYVPVIPDDWGTKPDALDTSDLFTTAKPIFDVAPFAESFPDIDTDLAIPATPIINTPNTPILDDIPIGNAPTITIPTFDLDFTGEDPGSIGDVVARYESEYAAALPEMKDFIDTAVTQWMNTYAPGYVSGLAELEAKIMAGLPGGQAMSDDVEQAIFDRARARVERERERNETEATEVLSKRGFDLPPGALAGALTEIQQNAANQVAVSATETAIERARLEVQHIQFLIGQSAALRSAMQQAFMQRAQQIATVNGQAMDYAQRTANLMVEAYNALLRRLEALLSAYSIQAQVYEVKVKSALAELEGYKVEVEVAKLKGDLQEQEVRLFSELIRAESTKIDLYLGELKGVATLADLEKLKAEIFGQQVNAYVALVKGKSAEFDAYKAAISGDAARVDAYSEQVGAYGQEVDAAKAILSGEIAQSDAIGKHNRNLIDQFKAELDKYGVDVDAESSRYAASADAYKTGLEAYKVALEADIQVLKGRLTKAELELNAASTEYNGTIKVAVANAGLFNDRAKAIASITNDSAGIAANIAGAALNSNNTMVSYLREE